MKNIAILLAAGSGTRVGGNVPKQFRTLKDGRTVLETCTDAFKVCPLIDDIVVITPELGGKTRSESSWKAINLVYDKYKGEEDVNVLIHDAARPFVSQRIIEDVCRALESHEAVTVAVPATDTMYECKILNAECKMPGTKCGMQNAERSIKNIPDRSTMWRAQTPQAFRLSLVRKAYEMQNAEYKMQNTTYTATDDCGMVHHYLPEIPIYIVEGEEKNKKITFKEDLE